MTFKDIQWAVVFLGLASIETALLYKMIAVPISPSGTEMIAAVCVVGILMVLASNVDRLESLSLTKGGLKVELENLKKETSKNRDAIVDLILGSMGSEAYENLKKFGRPEGYREYKKEHYMGLETELYHLRNLGYLHLKKGVKSIYDIPPEGAQLSDYIQITDAGREYIELREKHAVGSRATLP